MKGWLENLLVSLGLGSLGVQGLATGRPPSTSGLKQLDPDLVTLVLAAGQDAISPQGAGQLMVSLHALGCVVSLEIVAAGSDIFYQIVTPRRAADIVEGQIAVAYPTSQVRRGWDAFAWAVGRLRWVCFVMALEYLQYRPFFYPVKASSNFRNFDPTLSLLESMAQLRHNEVLMFQLLTVPADNSWNEKALQWTANLGSNPGLAREMERAIREKLATPLFKTVVRTASICPDPNHLAGHLRSLDVALSQFNSQQLNGFRTAIPEIRDPAVITYRLLSRQPLGRHATILSAPELANLWHLPAPEVRVQGLYQARGRTAPPPRSILNLPLGVPLGRTNCRPPAHLVGVTTRDRRQHLYILGRTGTGKSTLIKNMITHDMRQGRGVGLLDAHGDLAEEVAGLVPADRVAETIYFDPADGDYPLGFNLLEACGVRPSQVAAQIMDVFRLNWAQYLGPRMMDILHNSILTLLEIPGATLADIYPLLTSSSYRARAVASVNNPAVRQFWETRFNRWSAALRAQAVEPVLNKVDALLTDPLLYNILAQRRSSFDFREVMDRGKILICNVSRGRLGNENANLLGGLLLGRLEMAALSRADLPVGRRRDFYLYVDEFQRFATRSFTAIFSEARKYGLNLAVANQYLAQLPEGVRRSILGNVGSLISFGLGVADARLLAPCFAPVFETEDFLNLDDYHAYVRPMVNGRAERSFSIVTFPPPQSDADMREAVKTHTRVHYAFGRVDSDRGTMSSTDRSEDIEDGQEIVYFEE